MNPSFTKITFLLFIFCWLSHGAYAQSWQYLSQENAGYVSAGEVSYSSIVLDASGTPFVAYMDWANGRRATVRKFDGSGWVNVGSPGFSAGISPFMNLALNASGTPFVAYMDALSMSNKATVKKFDGTSWVDVGSPGFSAGTANYISLAIDAAGTPFVAYQDEANGLKATVRKYDGTNWVDVGVAGFSAGQAYYTCLALDADGMPLVAFQDRANGNNATVMKYNGTSWVVIGTAGFSTGRAEHVNLKLDAAGTPFVAYLDWGLDRKASVKKFNGTSWVDVGIAGFSAGTVNVISLALDAQGAPFVTYMDWANDYKATVMKFNGSSWVNVGPPGFSPGIVDFSSILVDAAGTVFVSYSIRENGGKATALKFAASPPTLTTGNLGTSAYCAGTSLNVSFSTTGAFAAGNTFAAQLSDAAGSFAAPTTIGSGTASPIAAAIPSGVAAGSSYRIRIVSAAPAVAGSDNGSNVIITSSAPAQPGAVAGATTVNAGATGLTYSVAPVSQASAYTWTLPAGWSIVSGQGSTAITAAAGSAGGQIAVLAVNACGQSIDRTLALAVTQPAPAITSQPQATSINGGRNATFTVAATGGALTYKWQVSQDGGASFSNISNGGVYSGAATATLTLTKAPISMNGYQYRVQVSNGGMVTTSNAVALTVNVPAFDNSRVWQAVGTAGFSGAAAYSTSLQFDAANTPYIAFRDQATGNEMTVMKYAGGNWVPVGAPGFSEWVVSGPSFTFDTSGTPYVAFIDQKYGTNASVMKYNGTSWENVGRPGFANATWINSTSIILDAAGTPMMAVPGSGLVYRYTGSSWEAMTSMGANGYPKGYSDGSCEYPQLAPDPTGGLYVVYQDWANGGKATVSRYGGSGWAYVGPAGLSAGVALYPSIALDANGTPYIAYQDEANGSKIAVKKYTGSGWADVGPAGISPGAASVPCLVLDAGGTPLVAFMDKTRGEKVTVRRYTGTGWEDVGGAGFSAGRTFAPKLALDANGTPFVSFGDEGNKAKATVMQFAASPPTLTTGNIATSAFCAGTSLNVSFTATGAFAAGNTFTAQLSDAAGSFASPTPIGSGTASPITAAIPADALSGAGYRIRVVASAPSVAGSNNGVNVTIESAPAQPGDISGAAVICPGQTGTYAVAAVGAATSYRWRVPADWQITSGQGTASITVITGSTAGQIAVAAGNDCGQSGASTLAVGIKPAVEGNSIAADQVICLGTAPQALPGSTATGGNGSMAYLWESSTSGATEGFAPAPGLNNGKDYTPAAGLQLTSWFRRRATADNCPATATYSNAVKITALTRPAAPRALDLALCGSGAVTLTAAGAESKGSYRWYSTAAGGTAIADGATAAFITPVLTGTATYYVAVVSAAGCESERTAVTVIINPVPVVAAGDNSTVCVGAPGFSLTGFSPAGGTWSGAGVTAAGVFTPSAAGVGTHTLTYSVTQNGCTGSATRTITVQATPVVSLTPFANSCSGITNLALTGGHPAGGTWSGPGVSNGIFNAAVAGAGTHAITYSYTDSGGCRASASQNITVTTCTGIEEEAGASDWSLYPNPTPDKIKVEGSVKVKTSLVFRIVRPDGSVVLEKVFPHVVGAFKQVFDLKGQAKGLYLLQLITDQGMVTKQFVLQ